MMFPAQKPIRMKLMHCPKKNKKCRHAHFCPLPKYVKQ